MIVVPSVHAIPSVRLSRAYLIVGDSLALVDSGLPWDPKGIISYIRSIGRHPSELEQILVTHSHPDHTGGTRSIGKVTSAAVFAHRSDTVRGDRNKVTLHDRAIRPFKVPRFLQTPVTTLVEDGDLLPVGGGLRVIHTPGHTTGSVCFLLEKEGVLFSGDTIFSDGTHISRSVPFPGYDRGNYIRSLERLSEFDFDVVCGGHGAPLMKNGSDVLLRLLEQAPNPPTWGDFFRGLPKRLGSVGPITGEHH